MTKKRDDPRWAGRISEMPDDLRALAIEALEQPYEGDGMTEKPKHLTVADLIAKLRDFPPECPVVVQGYEGGFDYVDFAAVSPLAEADAPEWWDGQLEDALLGSTGSIDAVVLLSERRRQK